MTFFKTYVPYIELMTQIDQTITIDPKQEIDMQIAVLSMIQDNCIATDWRLGKTFIQIDYLNRYYPNPKILRQIDQIIVNLPHMHRWGLFMIPSQRKSVLNGN